MNSFPFIYLYCFTAIIKASIWSCILESSNYNFINVNTSLSMYGNESILIFLLMLSTRGILEFFKKNFFQAAKAVKQQKSTTKIG